MIHTLWKFNLIFSRKNFVKSTLLLRLLHCNAFSRNFVIESKLRGFLQKFREINVTITRCNVFSRKFFLSGSKFRGFSTLCDEGI